MHIVRILIDSCSQNNYEVRLSLLCFLATKNGTRTAQEDLEDSLGK